MTAVDRLRARWWRRAVDRRATARAAELERAGAPFSQREVELLAFCVETAWTGAKLTRARWQAHGPTVCDAWATAVANERRMLAQENQQLGITRRRPPERPQPWAVSRFGWPTRP